MSYPQRFMLRLKHDGRGMILSCIATSMQRISCGGGDDVCDHDRHVANDDGVVCYGEDHGYPSCFDEDDDGVA